MAFFAGLKEIAQFYGNQYLGRSLVRAGGAMRCAANRLTSYMIMRQYRPMEMPKIIGNICASYNGSKKDLVCVALPECKADVESAARQWAVRMTSLELKQFRSGEDYVRLEETVRGKTVIICEDFSKTANLNDALVRVLLTIDAAKRADAKEVLLACPGLPYMEESLVSPDNHNDYFKLMLNLLFKAAGLDELRMGNIVLNRRESLLLLQDVVLSRNIAPVIMARGRRMLEQVKRGHGDLIFMSGRNYQSTAQAIVAGLNKNHGLHGQCFDFGFQANRQGKIDNSKPINSTAFAGKTVYVFQTCNTGRVNDDFIEALLMIYSAKKRGAKEVVLVMPFLPYNRQERKDKPRVPISAKLITNALVKAAGVDHIITLDLHAPATQGFVDIPMQHVTAFHLIAAYIKDNLNGIFGAKVVPAAPDVGRAKTVRKVGKEVMGKDYKFIIIDKDRPEAGVASVAAVVGEINGEDAILLDDMIDSGGTIINAAKAIRKRKEQRLPPEAEKGKIFVATIHPVFSDVDISFTTKDGRENLEAREELEAIKRFLQAHQRPVEQYVQLTEKGFRVNALIRLQASPDLNGIIFTDSINVPRKNIIDDKKIIILSIGDLMATVCGRVIKGGSIQDYQSEGRV